MTGQRLIFLRSLALFGVLFGVLFELEANQPRGSLQGQVSRQGEGLSGVTVVIAGTSHSVITDSSGKFLLPALITGTYQVIFLYGDQSLVRDDVVIEPDETTLLDQSVPWDVGAVFTATVYAASRRQERIVEAPAAITAVSEREIAQSAAHGQLAKLLEFTPGAEITQSGLYDFNLNARGFNSSLNRRVAVLVDGRDISTPFLSSQEWAALSFPLDELGGAELVRGPSAALYGANASSGVFNMTTRQPRFSPGGKVRFTAGGLKTTNLDLRWAGDLTNGWHVRVAGGAHRSEDFSVSRNGRAEYSIPCTATGQTDCLPQEPRPLPEDENEILFGSLRLDKVTSGGRTYTFEGGISDLSGPVVLTGAGRLQLQDVQRPWARFNVTSDRWNVLGYYNGRKAPRQFFLPAARNNALDTYNIHFEGQTNWQFAENRIRTIAGGSYTHTRVDSLDPLQGRQTLIRERVSADRGAGYAQFEFDLNPRAKVVLAGRVDSNTLHDTQFSPKAALVLGLSDAHSLRVTYNEGFQVANFSEFFLEADIAPPINLTALEQALCAPFNVTCGFGQTQLLALGNRELTVEKVRSFEIGYSGIFSQKAFVTADYYRTRNRDFITDLLPQIGADGTRTNPEFGPYRPPSGHPNPGLVLATLQASLPPNLFAILSNREDGTPIFAALSYRNFGQVDTQGVELGLTHYFRHDLSVSGHYSWFDFDLENPDDPLAGQLQPNSPGRQGGLGISYQGPRWDASLRLRWVEGFRWGVGAFQGRVDSYSSSDLYANYQIHPDWKIGLNVANLFDDRHWESFGGDLLRRRALVHLTYTW